MLAVIFFLSAGLICVLIGIRWWKKEYEVMPNLYHEFMGAIYLAPFMVILLGIVLISRGLYCAHRSDVELEQLQRSIHTIQSTLNGK